MSGTLEADYTVNEQVGPTMRDNLTVTSPGYEQALFSEGIAHTMTTSAVVIDLTKDALGVAHPEWLKEGFWVVLQPRGGDAFYRCGSAFVSAVGATTTGTTSNGLQIPAQAYPPWPIFVTARERYLDFVGTASGRLFVFRSQHPRKV
jgi:hypothetical protein